MDMKLLTGLVIFAVTSVGGWAILWIGIRGAFATRSEREPAEKQEFRLPAALFSDVRMKKLVPDCFGVAHLMRLSLKT